MHVKYVGFWGGVGWGWERTSACNISKHSFDNARHILLNYTMKNSKIQFSGKYNFSLLTVTLRSE
jgi:hypothetical protein